MNKKLLSCLLAFTLCCVFAFSAAAVNVRTFVADVAPPFEENYDFDETVPEGETFVLYGEADDPAQVPAQAPSSETDAPQEKSPVKAVLICCVIGLVIALIVVLSVKSSYKPVRRRSDAAEYLVDGSLQVTASNETFIRSDVSERTIENKKTNA